MRESFLQYIVRYWWHTYLVLPTYSAELISNKNAVDYGRENAITIQAGVTMHVYRCIRLLHTYNNYDDNDDDDK